MDILINNAGVAQLWSEEQGREVFCQQARAHLATNYWGTRRVCRLLGPLLSPGARLVMVTSSCGWLGHLVTPSILLTCGDKVIKSICTIQWWNKSNLLHFCIPYDINYIT